MGPRKIDPRGNDSARKPWGGTVKPCGDPTHLIPYAH